MKTIKLYDENSYLTEFCAKVLSCEKTECGYAVILDKTAFFPEEGGQNADTGTIDGVKVLDVKIKDDIITHYVKSEISGEVTGKIDWDARYDKMQQHTGEHIVSGLVHRLYGYDNVGFHLGDDDVTFDFNGPFTREQLDKIELLANEAIYKNAPILTYYPDDPKTLEYRAKADISGAVRIVEIKDIDMCACCAPHVKTTGEVGIIKLLEAQSYKGGVRIHMACGRRAVLDYQTKFYNLGVIATALSSGKNNAAEFFTKYQDDVASLKLQLSQCKKTNLELRANAVENTEGDIVIFDAMDAGDVRGFVNSLDGKYGGMCAVFSENQNGGYNFVVASKREGLKDVADALRKTLGAKCGGSDAMIQGSVNATENDIRKIMGQ